MKLKLSQQHRELAYSTFLVVIIPVIIAAGAVWLTSRIKADFDQELRRKANLAAEVFGVSAANILATNSQDRAAPLLQQLIDSTRAQAPEIQGLGVSVPVPAGFFLVASSDSAKVAQLDTAVQTQFAWSRSQPVASLIAAGEGGTREWLVASPISGSSGNLGIVTVRVSLVASDQLIAATLNRTYAGLGVIIVVIVLLLLNHFRFVQFAQLFRQQKQLDQMKDDFISVATHELKAPIGIIKGYISMTLDEKDLTSDSREMLTIGLDQTDRLNHLITDLLDVSRLEQGSTKYKTTPLQLPQIIRPMMSVFEVKAKDKQLKLSYVPASNVPLVLADPDRVAEIFTNLIDNAIKYSRTGSVTIVHEVSGTSLLTRVTDTGIGMTPDELSRLFQRFYRAKNDDTRDISGTGLGLWIIRQYAQAMHGDITVVSQKGQGSTFTVSLPLVATAQKT